MPFLENVTRGRGIPASGWSRSAEHYFAVRRPQPDQRPVPRAARGARERAGRPRGIDRRRTGAIGTGGPSSATSWRRPSADGHRRMLAVTTSAYSVVLRRAGSTARTCTTRPPSTRRRAVGADRPDPAVRHPSRVSSPPPSTPPTPRSTRWVQVDGAPAGLRHPLDPRRDGGDVRPEPAARTSGWHRAVAAEVTRRGRRAAAAAYDHDLVYCSRSGPPSQPWLEPDVNDHLRACRPPACRRWSLVPIGFVSDHMEVVLRPRHRGAGHRRRARAAGVRAATAGTHPAFVGALVDLLAERAAVRPRGEPDRGSGHRGRRGRLVRCPRRLLPEPARAGPSGAVPGRR